MIATRDFRGVQVRELLGPRDLSCSEATAILGARIGQPDLKYVQLPYAELATALVEMGVSEDVANLYAEISRALNEGKVTSLEGRRPENTTETTFEEFSEELSEACLTRRLRTPYSRATRRPLRCEVAG